MTDSIGKNAGILWEYLYKNGPTAVSKVSKETTLDTKSLQRAIGWLAKEDKVHSEMKGRTEIISLK